MKLDAKKTIHEKNVQRFTAVELHAIGEEVFALSMDFARFAHDLKPVAGTWNGSETPLWKAMRRRDGIPPVAAPQIKVPPA